MAAKFEFEANESIETARNLFQRALRFLPNSKKVWLEVCRNINGTGTGVQFFSSLF